MFYLTMHSTPFIYGYMASDEAIVSCFNCLKVKIIGLLNFENELYF